MGNRKMTSGSKKTIKRIMNFKYQLILEGACVGIIAGFVVSVLRLGVSKGEHLREYLLERANGDPRMIAFCIALLGLSFLVVCLCIKFASMSSGSGIPQLKGELRSKMSAPWLRTLLGKLVGTTVTMFAGLSVGNEGPSVQLGAMSGKGFSRLSRRMNTEEKILMTCGAGAGLSCAFNAPLAGVIFALEDIHNNFSKDILVSTMASSVMANIVAYNIFGLSPVISFKVAGALPLKYYWMILILGVILGAFGVFFNKFTEIMQNFYRRFRPKYTRMIIPFALVIPLAFYCPKVLGAGYGIITDAAGGQFMIASLAIVLVIKFFYSMLCTTSEAPGGIFLPILVIGASTGALYAMIMGQNFQLSTYMANFAMYGMTGYFAAIIRAPITGIVLITEMTGDFTNFLSLTVVALMAYITADLMRGVPIYDQLLERLLGAGKYIGPEHKDSQHTVLLECEVYIGSEMDGKTIRSMRLPKGCLIISVESIGGEYVPDGSMVLHGGDKFTIMCSASKMMEVDQMMEGLCRTIQRD